MTKLGPDICTEVQSTMRDLLPAGTGVSAQMAGPVLASLYPTEAMQIEAAVPSRQAEFAAGRIAARQAMAEVGMPAAPIPIGPDRAPRWPEGVVGSITHSNGLCVAAASTRLASLGIDLEQAVPLPSELIPTICIDAEMRQIAGKAAGRLAKIIFCAKEAAYKAQYPITRALFDFGHLHVTLDEAAGGFRATFVKPAKPFAVGSALIGRFAETQGYVLAAVAIEAEAA